MKLLDRIDDGLDLEAIVFLNMPCSSSRIRWHLARPTNDEKALPHGVMSLDSQAQERQVHSSNSI